MAFGNEDRKSDRMDELLALIDKRSGGEKASQTKQFVRQYYEHVGWHDLAEMDLDEMYGSALSLWNFAQDHKAGDTLIRVYNPRFEEQGWKADHTIVEIVTDDMPFLVDSGTALLQSHDLNVHLIIHPIVRLRRAKDGSIADLLDEDAEGADVTATSCMHFEINEQTDPAVLKRLHDDLSEVYADVRASVEDWPAMRRAAEDEISGLRKAAEKSEDGEELQESADFLQWLHDDHFIFLGYRDYSYPKKGGKGSVDPKSGLGVLRDAKRVLMRELRDVEDMPADVLRFVNSPELLMVTKAEGASYIHRAARLDIIGVKQFDKSGKAIGQRLFAGLFTSVAYNRSPSEIPMLRRRVSTILKHAGLRPSSHDGKALVNILETYPRDELFQAEIGALFETSMGILQLQERQRVALFLRQDNFERFISCLVYVPRDNYSTDLRKRINKILAKAFNGEVTVFYTQLGESMLARLHVIVKTEPGKIPAYDAHDIEDSIVESARTWTDRLTEALVSDRGEELGLRTADRFGAAFPGGYTEKVHAQAAVFDIGKIEEALETGRIGMNLYRPIEAAPNEVRFKLYHPKGAVPLSVVMPMLENMGLNVIDEQPTSVRPTEGDMVMIHDFGLATCDGAAIDLAAVRMNFHNAFEALWTDDLENDGFNALVLSGLAPREITIIRAYAKFLRQAGITFSQSYIEETLAKHSTITRVLIELFMVRFDPTTDGKREAKSKALVKSVVTHLNDVINADEDRMLGRFLNCITSTLRTNFFQTAEDGGPKPALSFKFDSKALLELPLPAPLREIFVYSPRLEAVHLRFGLVARGGLRWSDRREDFRTEVLGLVKAQQVKNAVIVPVGSKGGFVLKRAPKEGGREAFMEEGVACYKTFLRSMLDITDNLVGGEIVPPVDVVRWDGDDPYLVVAADKGTATFSDYANSVSAEYGFWLDDAFASGGSQGYDHKKMGITARGAWESVKRHFREMGTNCQVEPFTCVGVGDMAGDVFGNGMLNSPVTKLVGAFNHMHIFIDPDPDVKSSYAERQRMFDLPRSSWTDYNAKLISKGGGIFERSAKSIKLTPEIRKLFDITEAELSPNDLIRVMLKAKVDLLWFGGIGTYIKSSDESHTDAGDRANDALRVNGEDLRARVVGEGANLGTTQLGRIEAAMGGVRLNTDSIDNSAGVDCSDHEVNIKILLGGVVNDGDMTMKQRNKQLVEMTDEVGELVLRDNYLQSQAISLVEHGGVAGLHPQRQLMRMLERQGRLNRSIEYLPDDEELQDRQNMKIGMTRPEISILMPYAKIWLYDELLASDLPDDPQLEEDLVRYFPTALREKFRDQIGEHRLRREIITTVVANSMINRVGGWFAAEIGERTGMGLVDIARAYTITRDVFTLRSVWAEIESLDNKVAAEVQIRMLEWINKLISGGVLWFLRNGPHPLDISANIRTFRSGVTEIADNLDSLVVGDVKEILGRRAEKMIADNVPAALARKVANMSIMVTACDICRIAATSGKKVSDVGALYFKVGDRFGLDWIRLASDGAEGDSHWERLAVSAIVEDFYSHQQAITAAILQASKGKTSDDAIESWVAGNQVAVDRTAQLLGEFQSMPGTVDLAMLAVANRQFRTMIET